MRRWIGHFGDGLRWLLCAAVIASASAAATAAFAATAAAPAMDNAMSSSGWMQQTFIQMEDEATSDVAMLPDTPSAIVREWRTFDSNGSALGALVNVGWVALLTCLALVAETAAARGMTRKLRRRLRVRPEGPSVTDLLRLALCDVVGLAVFIGVFVHGRHWLTAAGVPVALIVLASNVLIRWRFAAVFVSVILRPGDPAARLIELDEGEAHRLARFLSAALLTIVVLVGFGRYGLIDEDSGAPHLVALIVNVLTCSLLALVVLRSRAAVEALIRGHSSGLVGALRAAIGNAWLAIGLAMVAGLFVFFIFGLSLGLLSYYYGVTSTLGLWLVLLVLERLTELGWRNSERAEANSASPADRLVGRSLKRILRAAALLVAAVLLGWIWSDAMRLHPGAAGRAMRATIAATATLFIAYVAWELIRVAIDRHLQSVGAGPKLPGASDDDEEGGPGSRLQTILPMLRFMTGALIAVVATLVVLSRLGIDTAPLIAGAGVFGLAISFGSQSLVRDIISGLFYLWDDAFRIGEYIDTGRLKGTVEALGIRSVKVRHQNGPLHTIPYGQLGAVTNMSRDFATIKFNLRLEPGVDLELVRRTAKKIGIAMQNEPAIASEVILPLKMQGIAEITDNAIVVRFKFTARPVKPTWVQREYLKRMYRMFAEQGIKFATGTLTLQTVPSAPSPEGLVVPAHSAEVVALPSRPVEDAPAAMTRSAAAQPQPA
ncbi:MAG TPA: mechanosensitive ion channel domain-containing protein [Stellaceae bacterium]|nr:mechanosensitive ion channel domain-containing protein [Stellaceae bacterium]